MKACVLIPSYNSGPLLRQTLAGVLDEWDDVFVVVDGSTDGSDAGIEEMAGERLRVHRLPENRGKGSAVLEGISKAAEEGFTHALAMDADGQHPAGHIARFMEAGAKYPEALVLGEPVFDEDAPALRVQGRKISNWWANLETCWWGIHDSLFGMRLYPVAPLKKVFSETGFARRFDFDPEVAVRLCWKGVPVLNLRTPVNISHHGGRGREPVPLSTGQHASYRYAHSVVLRIPAQAAVHGFPEGKPSQTHKISLRCLSADESQNGSRLSAMASS